VLADGVAGEESLGHGFDRGSQAGEPFRCGGVASASIRLAIAVASIVDLKCALSPEIRSSSRSNCTLLALPESECIDLSGEVAAVQQ
jgi:hypothetical protein